MADPRKRHAVTIGGGRGGRPGPALSGLRCDPAGARRVMNPQVRRPKQKLRRDVNRTPHLLADHCKGSAVPIGGRGGRLGPPPSVLQFERWWPRASTRL